VGETPAGMFRRSADDPAEAEKIYNPRADSQNRQMIFTRL